MAFVQEGRIAAVVHRNFSKIFDMASLDILVPKLGHYSLEGQTNR